MIPVSQGFADDQRARAAALFWEAFQGKLGWMLGPEARACRFLASVMQPQYALSAVDSQGNLLGIAGFKTETGGFVGGTLRDLAQVYGWPGALWRGPLLELFERKLAPGELLMDGIFVSSEARGQGVGTALINGIFEEARQRGCQNVRLDVIDGNPRARALYERRGFVERGKQSSGMLAPILGFRSATTMIAPVAEGGKNLP